MGEGRVYYTLAVWRFKPFLTGVTNTGNGERGTGNGEPGTGVWERVHSGNPYKNSKWRAKTRKKGLGTSFEHALFEFDRRSKQHGQ